MAKQMTLDTRKGIAHGLDCRLTFAQMANMFSRAVSTIANEAKTAWYGATKTMVAPILCAKISRPVLRCDEFVSFYGERARVFLEKLGIHRINSENVILDPILLGEKFKQEANRAILRKHGII